MIFFTSRPKEVLLQKLATVIGLNDYCDPDPSYVITVDNVMKMMAILMRFRSVNTYIYIIVLMW